MALRMRLSPAEQRVWEAFETGEWVAFAKPVTFSGERCAAGENAPVDGDSWGRERTVRGEVITALLLGAREPAAGTVPAVRLRGARISGQVVLRAGSTEHELTLSGCHLDNPVDCTGATTRTLRLTDCHLPGLNGGGMRVAGHLSLSGSIVTGPVRLARAVFESGLWMGGTKIVAGSEWALYTGAMVVDSGLYLNNADLTGGMRLVGARLNGGLFMNNTVVRNPGKDALAGDNMVVEDTMEGAFTAEGVVRLRGARFNGTLSITGVIRSPGTEYALHASHMEVRELVLRPAEPIDGVVSLAHSRVGTLRDDPETWPAKLRLNGLVYEGLRGSMNAERISWAGRDPSGFRPQPYEQLAAWYVRDGNEHLARRTQLAKLRARRSTFRAPGRIWGYLLDGTVGYGYRPWLAALWFVFLLLVGTVAFGMNPPRALKPAETPEFDAFAYTFDLLLPIGAFGQRGLFDPEGWTQGLAYGLITAGWILATALISGATRTLRPT
ncbi:hypothetical protein [Nonomuraea typhae]|uniref:hypothetical protein n=1 Tax=Nonomuraea typhae TaxID=2603600 RepID=UPI0012FA25EC|nr:hypothetical protein [Nonomuraea typhae]